MPVQNAKGFVCSNHKVRTNDDKSYKVMAVNNESLKLIALMELSF